MKIEDIEKKSLEYAKTATPTYVNGDFGKYAIADAFEHGANWRINSVWHTTADMPTKSGYLAVLCYNGIMETRHHTIGIGFLEKTLQGYSKWAYVEDLLPNKQEE